MNNQKRRKLDEAIKLLEQAKDIVTDVVEDEDFGFNNLSDGLQMSERGQQMEAAIENLNDAIDTIDEVVSYIEEAQA